MVLHRFIQSYTVDGELVHNPLWLHGNRLEVETLSASASGNLCTTLERAVSEAGLAVAGFVLEPVAIGRALLSPEEREMGVGIIDFGAGTSDLSVYRGNLRHVAEIAFGGEDITRDLSVVLNISPREAEELKHQHGGVCCNAEDGDEPISFSTTSGRTHSLLRHQLSEIIEARQQEILEFVAGEVRDSGCSSMLAAGVVFTGGGSLLRNLAQLGEEILGVPVRVGAAQNVMSAERMNDPRSTTAVGLLQFAAHGQADFADEFLHHHPIGAQTGILNRITKLFSFL